MQIGRIIMRWCIGLALVAFLCTAAAVQAGETKTRILLIGKDNDHAYGTHEYMIECKMLAKCLEQTKGVETVVSKGWPTDEKMLDGVKAIVLYTANGGDVILGKAAREQCLKMLNNGVGLTAIHWSTG